MHARSGALPSAPVGRADRPMSGALVRRFRVSVPG